MNGRCQTCHTENGAGTVRSGTIYFTVLPENALIHKHCPAPCFPSDSVAQHIHKLPKGKGRIFFNYATKELITH